MGGGGDKGRRVWGGRMAGMLKFYLTTKKKEGSLDGKKKKKKHGW